MPGVDLQRVFSPVRDGTSTELDEIPFAHPATHLPDGTPIHVKIYFENEFFEAKGKVVYAQSNLGMGATFEEMPTYAIPVLKKWLLRAMVSAKPSGS